MFTKINSFVECMKNPPWNHREGSKANKFAYLLANRSPLFAFKLTSDSEINFHSGDRENMFWCKRFYFRRIEVEREVTKKASQNKNKAEKSTGKWGSKSMDNPPREKIATDENFIELNGANLSGKRRRCRGHWLGEKVNLIFNWNRLCKSPVIHHPKSVSAISFATGVGALAPLITQENII